MRNVPLNNPYKILGVSRSATDDQIRKAYRRLAREHHPDMNEGDKESGDRFKQLSKAYETLSDPAKRRDYDMFGERRDRIPADRGRADISRPFQGASGVSSCRERKQNMWPWFGQRGNDLYYSLSLSQEEAFTGIKKGLMITRHERCTACHGTGSVNAHPCKACGGKGLLKIREVVEVKIPPGASTGQCIHLSGKGEAGWRGGSPGDLLVELVVKEPAKTSSIKRSLYGKIARSGKKNGRENEIALEERRFDAL